MVPQLLTFTPIGAMKSLISAVKDDDERDFANALPKASQVPAGNTPAAVRSIAASPNSPTPSEALPLRGSVIATVLTAPSAVAPVRVWCLPQHGRAFAEKHWATVLPAAAVNQKLMPRVGVPLPPKS